MIERHGKSYVWRQHVSADALKQAIITVIADWFPVEDPPVRVTTTKEAARDAGLSTSAPPLTGSRVKVFKRSPFVGIRR